MSFLRKLNDALLRFMRRVVQHPILSVMLALIVGLAVEITFEVMFQNTERAIIAALLAAMMTELTVVLINFKQQQEVMTILRENAELLGDDSAVSNFIAIHQIRALKKANHYTIVSGNGVTIEEPFVPDFWTLCISNIESELLVATYIDVDAWFLDPASDNNILIQEFKATIQNPTVKIHRTFIHDPDDDMEKLGRIAEEQAVRGIQVSFVSIERARGVAREFDLPSVNVHLIDRRWVGYHHMGADRIPTHFELTRDNAHYERAKNFFSKLSAVATRFTFDTHAERNLMLLRKRALLQAFRKELVGADLPGPQLREAVDGLVAKSLLAIGEEQR